MPSSDDDDLRYEVLETIRGHLATFDIDPDGVVEDADFAADLGADSLALETLAQELEDVYGIELGAREAAGLSTVALTIDYVVARVAPEPA